MPNNDQPMKRLNNLLLLVATTLVACGGETPATEGTARDAAPPVTVEVRTAALETLPEMIRVSGSLEPWRAVSPGTKILGRVAHTSQELLAAPFSYPCCPLIVCLS